MTITDASHALTADRLSTDCQDMHAHSRRTMLVYMIGCL